jgi:hypothetical protein
MNVYRKGKLMDPDKDNGSVNTFPMLIKRGSVPVSFAGSGQNLPEILTFRSVSGFGLSPPGHRGFRLF